jgi:hypothetical protein
MANHVFRETGKDRFPIQLNQDKAFICPGCIPFCYAFDKLYPEIENSEPAKFWNARLEYDHKPELFKVFTLPEIIMVVAIYLITAFIIKIPDIFQIGWPKPVFYEKNVALIVLFGLTLYTIWMNRISEPGKLLFTALAFLVPTIYINLLPSDGSRDSVNLAYVHLPMLMWFIFGFVFTGFDFKNRSKRIEFIKYNGDLAIIYGLIAIAGGLLTAITMGLFDAIGLNIQKFYFDNIVLTGAVAAPVVAALIIEKYPVLSGKIAPLIAGIFSPLVFITLIIFLVTVVIIGKNPYTDRDFLLVFNIMLLGVMGIIIFSVSGTSVIKNQKFNAIVLFALSIITIIIDLIALSAIFYRLGEFGLTPNRLAVLVSNILVLVNLVLIMTDLFRINFKGKEFKIVEMTVSKYLPVYLAWVLIVIFLFPAVFGMR